MAKSRRLSVGFGVLLMVVCLPICANAQESALDFDGIDDFATTGSPVGWPSGSSTVTFEVWVNPDDVSGSDFRGIVVNDMSINMVQEIWDNSILAFSISNGPTDSAETPTGSLVAGRWDHFAGTYDGTTMRIYQNGELVAEKEHSGGGGTIGISHRLFIGSWPSAGNFDGVIDEVRIWNDVRTQAEIRTWMSRPLTGTETGLLGYWRFNEGSGQAILDSTAYGSDGILGSTSAGGSDDPQWTDPVPYVAFFYDGFETGDTTAWSNSMP